MIHIVVHRSSGSFEFVFGISIRSKARVSHIPEFNYQPPPRFVCSSLPYLLTKSHAFARQPFFPPQTKHFSPAIHQIVNFLERDSKKDGLVYRSSLVGGRKGTCFEAWRFREIGCGACVKDFSDALEPTNE